LATTIRRLFFGQQPLPERNRFAPENCGQQRLKPSPGARQINPRLTENRLLAGFSPGSIAGHWAVMLPEPTQHPDRERNFPDRKPAAPPTGSTVDLAARDNRSRHFLPWIVS
jgi:hypothetical protein